MMKVMNFEQVIEILMKIKSIGHCEALNQPHNNGDFKRFWQGGDFSLQSRIMRDFVRNDREANLESGDRVSGAKRPTPDPFTRQIHGHSDGVPKHFACLPPGRLSGRLRNPLLTGFQLCDGMRH